MVLVHHDRNVRIGFDRRLYQVTQKRFAGVFSRTGRALHDDRAVGLGGRFHDGAHLFEVVDVEGRQSVVELSGMIEKLAHRDEGHERSPLY